MNTTLFITIATQILFFTPCTYTAAAADDLVYPSPVLIHENSNDALRDAIIRHHIADVQKALEDNADPNYTPAPHKLTCMQRCLKKCWYVNQHDISQRLKYYGCALIARGALHASDTTPSPAIDYALISYAPYFISQMLHTTYRTVCKASSEYHVTDATPPLIVSMLPPEHVNQVRIVQLLMDARANIHLTDEHGNTALHIAVDHPRQDLPHLLQWAGADPNARDNHNLTPYSTMMLGRCIAHFICSVHGFKYTTNDIPEEHIAFAKKITDTATHLSYVADAQGPFGGAKDIASLVASYYLTHENESKQWALRYRILTSPTFNHTNHTNKPSRSNTHTLPTHTTPRHRQSCVQRLLARFFS